MQSIVFCIFQILFHFYWTFFSSAVVRGAGPAAGGVEQPGLLRLQLQYRQHRQGGVVQQVSHNLEVKWHTYVLVISSSLQGEERGQEEQHWRHHDDWARRMQGLADQLWRGVPGEDDSDNDDHDDHDVLCQFIFAERRGDDYSCHHCVHIYVRTVNIIEKKESGCIQLPPGQRSWDNICNRRGQYSDGQSGKQEI